MAFWFGFTLVCLLSAAAGLSILRSVALEVRRAAQLPPEGPGDVPLPLHGRWLRYLLAALMALVGFTMLCLGVGLLVVLGYLMLFYR